jgi:hypothetical protein
MLATTPNGRHTFRSHTTDREAFCSAYCVRGKTLIRGGTEDVLSMLRNDPAGGRERHFQTEHLLGDLERRSFRGGVVTLSGQAVKLLLQMI